MNAPLIAIVGRPNVGKSTLFNRLVGGRPALVHDTPHLTRDRRYGECDYFGAPLRLVDTGGLDPDAAAEIIGAGIHRQALRAIDEANAVVLVVDGRTPVSRRSCATIAEAAAREPAKTSVFLAINKIDHTANDHLVHDFHELGLNEIYPVSASHGRGIDPLLEAVTAPVGSARPAQDDAEADGEFDPLFDEAPEEEVEPEPETPQKLRVAFIGRPNAGKSSLTNRLLGEERSLVHHEGRHDDRNPVDAEFSIGGKDYILVDTTGIRRKARIEEDIERIAAGIDGDRSAGSSARMSVVLVIDADLGPSSQDVRGSPARSKRPGARSSSRSTSRTSSPVMRRRPRSATCPRRRSTSCRGRRSR